MLLTINMIALPNLDYCFVTSLENLKYIIAYVGIRGLEMKFMESGEKWLMITYS
jgi:hypothetical protein